jgi:hypothetical protein
LIFPEGRETPQEQQLIITVKDLGFYHAAKKDILFVCVFSRRGYAPKRHLDPQTKNLVKRPIYSFSAKKNIPFCTLERKKSYQKRISFDILRYPILLSFDSVPSLGGANVWQ